MVYGTMDWNRRLAFWRRNPSEVGTTEGAVRQTALRPRTLEEWEARLLGEGVAPELAARVAPRLESLQLEFGRGASEALIQAAAATADALSEATATVERNLRDVREVERLLSAFSGELEKLDEVLEVLSAYAQRMRNKPKSKAGSAGADGRTPVTRKPGHTLH